MGIISKLTPTNIRTERERFFNDLSYNPQFHYEEVLPAEILYKWGRPEPHLVEYATQTLRNIPDLHMTRVMYENQEIEQRCRFMLAAIGVTEEISIQFISQKVTRCSVSKDAILFQDRPRFNSEQELAGTLNHEIQTHLLRNLNQQKQAWPLDRENHDREILHTEEGLAVLHSLLDQPVQKLFRPCAYYLAVELSLRHSFSEAFHILMDYGFDTEFAWRLCLRTKRGLTDTSLPGANTKDICYLGGVLDVWRWVILENNDPRDLYLGKIYLEEVAEKKTLTKTKDVYLPLFLQDLEKYRSTLVAIGDANNLASFLSKGT